MWGDLRPYTTNIKHFVYTIVAGELEYTILQTLLSNFPRINHCAVEPSASLHGEYKDSIVGKPEFIHVDFTWEHRTFDSYRVRAQAVSDTAQQFDFINAFDSLYYVDDLQVAMEFLYKHLSPGGMLLIRLISGKIKLSRLRISKPWSNEKLQTAWQKNNEYSLVPRLEAEEPLQVQNVRATSRAI